MIRVVGTLPLGPGIVVVIPHVSHLDGPLLAACLGEKILWGGGSGIHGDPALESGSLADMFFDWGGDRALVEQ